MLTKSARIASRLLQEIADGRFRPGDKIPSRHRLARKFECSRTTVERAVAALTRSGRLVSRRGAGTVVGAPAARPGVERLFIVAAGDDPVYDRTLRELIIPERGLELPLYGVKARDAALAPEKLSAPGSAVVWLMPDEELLYVMDYLAAHSTPQLLVNRQYRDYDRVYTDPEASIREGLAWLMIEAGREIAFITREATTARPYLAPRIIAFYRLCVELGARLRPDAVFSREFDDAPEEIAEVAGRLFAGRRHPRGIFVMNQELVLPLIACAQGFGLKAGRDYFLLTFDLIPELTGYPGVGMMRQQYRQIYLAVRRWLLSAGTGAAAPFREAVKTELVSPPEL